MAEGTATTLGGLAKTRIADFVHGTDGFGNTNQAAVEVHTLTGQSGMYCCPDLFPCQPLHCGCTMA